MDKTHRVAIVVDPTFGDGLAELSKRVHVWVCDSPENRRAAEQAWASHPDHSLERGVTLFKYSPSVAADEVCLGILETVELHHGQWSHKPAWGEVEVHGTKLTPALQAALAELEFSAFKVTTDGFIAVRQVARSG